MGWFSGIKDSYKQSEASTVLQEYFARQTGTLWGGRESPESLANKLIDITWNMHPAFFNGEYGARPHKLTLAACSLSNAIDSYGLFSKEADCLPEAFIEIMTELSINGAKYNLNPIDKTILMPCHAIYQRMIRDTESLLNGQSSA